MDEADAADLPLEEDPTYPAVRSSGGAVFVWCLLFALLHLYWALGGRVGLEGDTAEADAALARPLFIIYNLIVIVLSFAGAVLALLAVRGRTFRSMRLLLSIGSVSLLIRGGIGVVLLLFESGGLWDSRRPLVLTLVEPWFIIGGLALGWLRLALRDKGGGVQRDEV